MLALAQAPLHDPAGNALPDPAGSPASRSQSAGQCTPAELPCSRPANHRSRAPAADGLAHQLGANPAQYLNSDAVIALKAGSSFLSHHPLQLLKVLSVSRLRDTQTLVLHMDLLPLMHNHRIGLLSGTHAARCLPSLLSECAYSLFYS